VFSLERGAAVLRHDDDDDEAHPNTTDTSDEPIRLSKEPV